MARGMAAGEGIQSQAATPEYREAHERIFGDGKPQRGRWVWDPRVQRLVSAEDYVPPEEARDAPIMVDRWYEGTKALDGTDIGSRRKHRAYMKDRGLAPADDFSPGWYDKVRREKKREQDQARRESIARAIYKMDKP
jgi:hypothetical protein